ncbi:MAG: tRNA (guanosine(37)-N1)-methyltransferase TrmD [Phycisphaerae bacterium]|nr:tRNA (guanosine(37)-N1)-methyltransferase TrmD [Phycisphaerae bacterium]
MRIDVLTLFPEMFEPVLNASILRRASEAGRTSYHLTDIRQYTTNKHGKVDNRPYGGGPGMVMGAQPIWDAVAAVESSDPLPARRILMTPQGQRVSQPMVEQLAAEPRLLIIAGHYEGLDERVIEALEPLELSIGDYVLSGGELPAMVLIDAVVRLIPGVLGHEESAHHDSFAEGAGRLLDHPHYTRPPQWRGRAVPEVLQSGDHAAIEQWRREQAEARTRQRRPDLLAAEDTQTQPRQPGGPTTRKDP